MNLTALVIFQKLWKTICRYEIVLQCCVEEKDKAKATDWAKPQRRGKAATVHHVVPDSSQVKLPPGEQTLEARTYRPDSTIEDACREEEQEKHKQHFDEGGGPCH
jgi:hypothetical protein